LTDNPDKESSIDETKLKGLPADEKDDEIEIGDDLENQEDDKIAS